MKILQIQTAEKENEQSRETPENKRNKGEFKKQDLVTETIMQPLRNKICKDAIDVIAIGEWGKSAAVHLSAELGIPCLSGVEELQMTGDTLSVFYNAYQANVRIRHETALPVILVVKPEAEDALIHMDFCETEQYRIHVEPCKDTGVFTEEKEEVQSDFGQDTILVIGHGAGGKENVQEICAFAQKYGFGVGATRPVVTDGWITSRHLIGISGSVIAPKVCMVLGASGSQAFMAGIGKSEIIFSVNTDSDAMIFEKSDYGLVMDCMQFIRKLDAEWRKSSGE